MKKIHVTILTDNRYVSPEADTTYIRNILEEDELIMDALRKEGLRVDRKSWDDPGFRWDQSETILFRSTWDYFDRFGEFSRWLRRVDGLTRMINDADTIRWNLDKHYLKELKGAGIPVPPTAFVPKGTTETLSSLTERSGWKELILKPVVSGGARHTYRFQAGKASDHEDVFRKLTAREDLMIQEFQHQVLTMGEVAFMVMDGRFTHAVLKKAKAGDFRVQDDFGGTVHPYAATDEEVAFAEDVVARCGRHPLYARVDAIWDRQGRLMVSELELIEPELWFRLKPEAARILAGAIHRQYFQYKSNKT